MAALTARVGEPRILIVEDDEDLRAVLKDFFEERRFAVDEACNGQVALDLMTSAVEEPALVIMDLEMPILTGAELLGAMKMHPRLSNVPVLVLSGSARALLPKSERIVARLSKPCDWEKLLGLVHEFMAVRTPRTA